MGKIRLIELIDQTPAIKSKFKTENITMFSGYDMHTHKRTSGGMDFEMIYKDLEFQLWRDELCLELAQLKQDEFIIDLMKQLNGFSGWGDKERFQKIESKLQVLKGRIEEYIVELSPAIAEDKRIPEQMLIDKMTRALTKLQRNHNYNSASSEDTMNDCLIFLYFAKCDTLIVKMLKYEKAQNSAQNAANCGNLGGIFE